MCTRGVTLDIRISCRNKKESALLQGAHCPCQSATVCVCSRLQVPPCADPFFIFFISILLIILLAPAIAVPGNFRACPWCFKGPEASQLHAYPHEKHEFPQLYKRWAKYWAVLETRTPIWVTSWSCIQSFIFGFRQCQLWRVLRIVCIFASMRLQSYHTDAGLIMHVPWAPIVQRRWL